MATVAIKGEDDLRRSVRALTGVTLNEDQLASFAIYASELFEWNQRSNLTSISSPGEVERKHFLDSLSCLLVMGTQPVGRLIDIGSGAGFPGLPLKIAAPSLTVLLVDSVAKKLDFCQHMIDLLKLKDIEILHARAEEVGRLEEHRQTYDWAVARSVASLPTLVEYLLPQVKIGGRAIAQKGTTASEETQDAEEAVRTLGGELEELLEVELPGVDAARFLVVLKMVQETPAAYPRRDGVPAKRPLGS